MASRKFNLILCLLLSVSVFAQKNLVPVSSSAYTGIDLPAGTRQDKRVFNVALVMTFLEGETKKYNVTVSDAEVFRLPPGVNHTESLKTSLNTRGWEIRQLDDRPEYAWLIKQGQYYFMYWSFNVKNPELYFGKLEGVPALENSLPVVSNQPVTKTTLPPVQQNPSLPTAAVSQQTQTTVSPNSAPTVQPVRTGNFTFSVTNWDDGWVSTIENDKVVVTKGAIKVHVYYPVSHNDASRHAGRDFYWDNYLAKEFRILTKQYRDHGEVISSFQAPYIEGTAIDTKTGKNCFLAMYVTSSNGNMFPVVAVMPDEATLRKTFPNAEKEFDSELPGMSRYNRFAVALNDIIGKWSGGGSATANYYNAYTGAYAGMGAVAMSDKFEFFANSDYVSKHQGASGMVGSMSTYSQEYKGKATVSNWEIVLPNRWEGKTSKFNAWFEAVRGGRILNLQDMQYSGSRYSLVKE
ncbi:MAG: hypothetical protein KF725_10895 [Cyclobacteriaceae bacterium]|nr:hypothetical protein [Cyclobacteriaceae bacterium]UYN86213.1 MAG: hypothetical protein KIT51_15285 [Cyclobacteriaceae bacterium]